MNVDDEYEFTIGWSVNEAAREFYMSMEEGVLQKPESLE